MSRQALRFCLSGVEAAAGLILVVTVAGGPTLTTREQMRLSGESNIPVAAVFLDVEGAEDDELIALVELEIRELLSASGLPGDTTAIIKGSSAAVLDNGGPNQGKAAFLELIGALDAITP